MCVFIIMIHVGLLLSFGWFTGAIIRVFKSNLCSIKLKTKCVLKVYTLDIGL